MINCSKIYSVTKDIYWKVVWYQSNCRWNMGCGLEFDSLLTTLTFLDCTMSMACFSNGSYPPICIIYRCQKTHKLFCNDSVSHRYLSFLRLSTMSAHVTHSDTFVTCFDSAKYVCYDAGVKNMRLCTKSNSQIH
jgi:hypothetical protein